MVTNKCENCKWWSDLIAKYDGDKIMAICENSISEYHGKYVEETDYCGHHDKHSKRRVAS